MRRRLIGVAVLGAATLLLGALPAHAGAGASTKVVTAPTTTAKYVEWSAPTKYVEWSAPTKYVEWSAPTKYVEW